MTTLALALMQVAVATATSSHDSGPTWRSLAVACGGVVQIIVFLWIKSISDERRAQSAKIEVLERLMTEMATHIGINGNGMLATLHEIKEEMKGMRKDFGGAMQEMAEQRGEHRGAQQHTRHMRES